MNQHFHHWVKNCTKGILTLAIFIFNHQIGLSQMSGNYTINRGATSSSTNFTSFQSLADSLQNRGINGAVTISVVSGSGPYNENVVFNKIAGVSQNNTISINGNANTISHAGSSTAISTILLQGVEYMTIQNLTVVNTGNSLARNIQLKDSSNNNKIINCTLTQPNMTSTSASNAYLYLGNAGSNTMLTYSMAGQNNIFQKIKCNAGTNIGPYAGFCLVGPRENDKKKPNIIDSCEISDFFIGGIISYYQDEGFECSNNIIFNNIQSSPRREGRYGIYCEHVSSGAEIVIKQNKIFNLNGSNANGPIPANFNLIGIYVNDNETLSSNKNKIFNNIIDIAGSNDISGIRLLSIDAPGSDVEHNTILLRNPATARNQNGTAYGLLHNDLKGNVRNNIFYCNFNITSGDLFFEARLFTFGNNNPLFSYNCMNLSDVTGSGGKHYGNNGSNLTTWSAWLQSSVNDGNNFNAIHPRIVDPNNGNYNFGGVGMSKKGTSIAYITKDINGNNRDTSAPQVGALESYVDYAITSLDFSTKTSECSNFEKEITLTLKNNNNFTARDIPVTYDVNGRDKITEVFQDTIGANDSAIFTFSNSYLFSGNGTTTLNVYIEGEDENNGNNLQSHTFNLVATPFGVKLTEGMNFPGYYRGGTKGNPDVTVPDFEVEYELSEPSKYTFSDYGTAWQITNKSVTLNGDTIGGNEGLIIDGSNGSMAFDPISILEGETIEFRLLIQDLNTECDTTVSRYLHVPHTPKVDFEAKDACLDETPEFKNLSTMAGSNIMLNKWRFNDPNVAEDTSEATDGFYKYTTFGTKHIDLEVINQAYPKFVFSLRKSIEIKPLPLISFRIRNGCEGIPISFTNNTTLPSGVSDTITYSWNFGDGSSPQTDKEPTHLFQNSGEYLISLKATLNGCTAEQVRNANQFPTPKADFTANSVCANKPVIFNNITTISSGNVGFVWNFGNNLISTNRNPEHTYTTSGQKTISLKATSEFGCENEITKTVDIKESPKANFDYDRACILTPTQFNYVGEIPQNITTTFYWDFNSETVSSNKNPSYLFSGLGTKTVKLILSSDNGCMDSITKTLNVLLQPIVDFEYTPICSEEDMMFVNKSRIDNGNLIYSWNFGNGMTSTDVSPNANFGSEYGQKTVSLTAFFVGGCSNTIEKEVIIYELPSSEFDIVKKEGKNVMVKAKEENVSYAWRMGDGNAYNSQEVDHFYEIDNGAFKICLSTLNSNNCKSKNDEMNCQSVNINIASLERLVLHNELVKVFPNPSLGKFKIAINAPSSYVEISVLDILGNAIPVNIYQNVSGEYEVNLGNVSSGVYLIQVKNGTDLSTKKITIIN